ncbi:hypothetical protein AY599_01885 [Leptolyngbya valderiana BDU 20041]|nr:hypothetical protein AY599_01885 [Leptolyngbya valderiana BDU 20041]
MAMVMGERTRMDERRRWPGGRGRAALRLDPPRAAGRAEGRASPSPPDARPTPAAIGPVPHATGHEPGRVRRGPIGPRRRPGGR